MEILSLCIDNKTHEHVRLCAQQDIQATIIRVSPFTRLTDHILGRCGKQNLVRIQFLKTELSKNLTSIQMVLQ